MDLFSIKYIKCTVLCLKHNFQCFSYLEAEGLERTHQFKQKDIVESLDISSAQRVCFYFYLV